MNDIFENFTEKDITFSLYGLLLGDGCYRKGWIDIYHTNKQFFYCEWLEKIFSDYGLIVTSKYNFPSKTNLGTFNYNRIAIKVPEKFYFESNNNFYDDNKNKIISEYVMENINILGILFWFLDDGQLHVSFNGTRSKRFGYLNTQSFTYEENQKIADMFKKRFDIHLRIHKDCSGFKKYKDKIYYRLYFNAENFRKFFDVVRPYLSFIPKEFYYKFNMQYKPNRLKESGLFTEKYNLTI